MHPAWAFGLVVAGTLVLGGSLAAAAYGATTPAPDRCEAAGGDATMLQCLPPSRPSVALVSLGIVLGGAALAAGMLGHRSSRSTRRT